MTTTGFQRARRPEQVEARRAAILSTARAMLAEHPVAEISLRELSDSVGLAKSNVLRYFDSREAVFLELLDSEWASWLDELSGVIAAPHPSGRFATEEHIASAIASSLAARPLLCELVSSMAAVLEKNISLDYARSFKSRSLANTMRLAALVRAQLPALDEQAGIHFSAATFVIVAGMWPYNTPSATIAQVTAELGHGALQLDFENNLRDGLSNLLVGLVARTGVAR